MRFRIVRPSEYENKVVMVAFKDPPWLSELEPSAPLNGYVMQQGEFAASLVKDDRIAKGLKVTIEVSAFGKPDASGFPSEILLIVVARDLYLGSHSFGVLLH